MKYSTWNWVYFTVKSFSFRTIFHHLFYLSFQHRRSPFIHWAIEMSLNVFLLHQVWWKHFFISIEWLVNNSLFSIGPGSYSIDRSGLNKETGFSFGLRPEQKVRCDTPSPNQYAAEQCNFRRTPSFTFGSRQEKKIKSDAPAPNHYKPEQYNHDHQAAFSFGTRTEQKIKSHTPGKSCWQLKSVSANKIFTLSIC